MTLGWLLFVGAWALLGFGGALTAYYGPPGIRASAYAMLLLSYFLLTGIGLSLSSGSASEGWGDALFSLILAVSTLSGIVGMARHSRSSGNAR